MSTWPRGARYGPHFLAWMKWLIGWLPESRIQTVQPGETATVVIASASVPTVIFRKVVSSSRWSTRTSKMATVPSSTRSVASTGSEADRFRAGFRFKPDSLQYVQDTGSTLMVHTVEGNFYRVHLVSIQEDLQRGGHSHTIDTSPCRAGIVAAIV